MRIEKRSRFNCFNKQSRDTDGRDEMQIFANVLAFYRAKFGYVMCVLYQASYPR